MKTPTRRSFVKTGLAGIAAIPLYHMFGCTQGTAKLPHIGLQMYTVRDEIEKDIKKTLAKVADMGLAGVESAFLPEGISIEEAGKLFKEYGLHVFAAHVELPVSQASKDEMLRIADAYQCKRMIWHGWPEDKRYKTESGTLELVEIYNEANRFARSNGLSFGVHNHWWEYEKQASGQYPFEILLRELDNEIFFEIDTYWVTVAGHEAAEIIRKFGERAPLIHIKDGPATYSDSLDADDPDPMVPLGKGSVNIPAIAAAARNSADWMIVELDVVRTDVFEAIKDSYDYMISNQYANSRS
ncbi:MAG: sugar phosphate isomerase/epimerase [Cyclobacteriaceae bacterium]|nr:sugar phosphate isomerase/epimerase [Cyclobacteriaceae bacterium]